MRLLANQSRTAVYAIEHIAKIYIFGRTEIWLTLDNGENAQLATYATSEECDRAFINLAMYLDLNHAPLVQGKAGQWINGCW